MREREELYENAMKNNGAPLYSCIGFKNTNEKPMGPNDIQWSCYSGHKQFNCIIY